MPIIFYALSFILFLVSLRFNKQDGFLDKESSNVIKGFFILLIVFSHILNAFPYSGFMARPLGFFRTILGQLCVSMFFFISGYGIIYSIESKGSSYSKSLFTNRFLRILIYTVIGLVPFFIYSACLGIKHPVGDYFLSFIGLKSFGNASWFIFAILVCYFISAIVYLFNWKNKYIPASIVLIGVLGYIFIMYYLKRPYWTWDTIICFVYGIIVALFRVKINSLLSKKKCIPYIFMALSIALVIALQFASYKYGHYFPKIIEMWFANAFFCLLFVCLTKVFTLKSPILSYLGKASFAIFIMHYLVICCFVDIGTITQSWLNYTILFIASTIAGIPVYYVYKAADKWIINPVSAWNRKLITNK